MTPASKQNILAVALILAAITIPLHNNLNSQALVLFCFVAAFQQPLRLSIQKLTKGHYWKLCAAFFIWMACTWFWDSSGGFRIKHLEPSAAFLFLPLVMTAMPKLSQKQLMTACYAFVVCVIVVCLVCLAKSYLEYRHTYDTRVFFYHYLGFQMNLNAIYLSNYCIACITWLLYYTFIYKGALVFKLPLVAMITACVFLFLMIFLLSSKLSLALLMLMITFMSLYIGYKRKALLQSFIIIAICMFAAFALANNFGYLNWRISELKWKEYSGPQDDQNGLALRRTTWASAMELIKEKPLLGYGLKGASDALVEKYREKQFEAGIPERYNSHNQFLETTLKSGLPGLLLLLLMIAIPLISAIRQKRFLLSLMLIHFLLVSMVEGTLEIQQELVFYWFFIFLFYYHYFPGKYQPAKNE